MSKEKLLFAASEVYPFAKSGGLADVAHSLPRVLNATYDVHVVMPLYRFIERKRFGIVSLGILFDIEMGGHLYPVEFYGCCYEGVEYRFIYTALLCDRDFIYGPPESGYTDNALRFALFNHAMLALLKQERYLLAHLNDWQSALLPLLIEEEGTLSTKTVFTIHNLAYQGVFERSVLREIGIPEKYFTLHALEFYGKVNFMKAGIAYADAVTTVSPTYAKEILTAEYGCGLEGFLAEHKQKLFGILNGIDSEHFSPSKDTLLFVPYSDMRGKTENKRAYLETVDLQGLHTPLFIFIGRFNWQKGLELFIESLDWIASQACNIAILGEGEIKYHKALEQIADKHANIHLEFGYDELLSHRMYAAADFFLMPSLFEPCGLAQMIAMNYGQMPIVHAVGGLADTVFDHRTFHANSTRGYGITFETATSSALQHAVSEALELYSNMERYTAITTHNMHCDFSWQESTRAYLALYTKIIKKGNHG